LIAAVVLFWKGWTARSRNYRHTEVWLMIEDAPALPRERLQDMIGGALADVYFIHARLAACMVLAMCVIGFAIGDPRIAAAQDHPAGTNRLDLAARKAQTSFVGLFDIIIVARFAIICERLAFHRSISHGRDPSSSTSA